MSADFSRRQCVAAGVGAVVPTLLSAFNLRRSQERLAALEAPRMAPPLGLVAATRLEMLRPQVKVDGQRSWSLGWEIRQTPNGVLIQHQGGQAGVQAFAAASVDRRSGYVILTNSDNGSKICFDEKFRTLIDQTLLS